MDNIAEDIVLNTDQGKVEQTGVTERVYSLIYKGVAPWEIGRVQPIMMEIEKESGFNSPIIDVGCGSGFNSYFLADHGHRVFAIDYLDEVIALARKKNPHSNIDYEVANVLSLGDRLKQFNTVLDSATFHGFSDEHRQQYVDLLRQHLPAGACIYVLGFSDKEVRQGGPRRLSAEVISSYFTRGFALIDTLYFDFEVTIFDGSVKAILAKIKKV